jgi:hypothetical protein
MTNSTVLNLTWEDWAELVNDRYLSVNTYFFIHGNEEEVFVEATDVAFKEAYEEICSKKDQYLMTIESTTYVRCSVIPEDDWYSQYLHESFVPAMDLPYYHTCLGLVVFSTKKGDNGFWGAESLN